MGQDITSVRFHRPGCRGGTPARRFAERPTGGGSTKHILSRLCVRRSRIDGHHAGSLCQMLKNHAVNAVMRGFAHAASVRHFVKSQSDAHQEPPERSC